MTDDVDADGRACGPRSRGRKESQVNGSFLILALIYQLPTYLLFLARRHTPAPLVGSCMAQFVVGSCTSKQVQMSFAGKC